MACVASREEKMPTDVLICLSFFSICCLSFLLILVLEKRHRGFVQVSQFIVLRILQAAHFETNFPAAVSRFFFSLLPATFGFVDFNGKQLKFVSAFTCPLYLSSASSLEKKCSEFLFCGVG